VDRASKDQATLEALVLIVLPGLVILILLYKATGYAKKASGQLGEAMIKGGKLALGLAAGVAVGGGAALAAKGLQGTVGRFGQRIEEKGYGKDWATNKDKGLMGASKRFLGGKVVGAGPGLYDNTFDIRHAAGGAVMKTVSGITGMKLSGSDVFSTEKGGRRGDQKKRSDREQEIAKQTAKMRDREPAKEALDKAVDNKNRLALVAEPALQEIDRKIDDLAKDKAHAGSAEKEEIAEKIKVLKQQKTDIKETKATDLTTASANFADATAKLVEAEEKLKENTDPANKKNLEELARTAAQTLHVAKAKRDTASASAQVGGKSIKELTDETHDLTGQVLAKENERLSNIAHNLENRWSLFGVRGAENKKNARIIRAKAERPEKKVGEHSGELGALGHAVISAGTEMLFNKEHGSGGNKKSGGSDSDKTK